MWLNPGVSVCMDDAFVPAIAIKISETGQFTSVGNKVSYYLANLYSIINSMYILVYSSFYIQLSWQSIGLVFQRS